jgi:hypothetical protein
MKTKKPQFNKSTIEQLQKIRDKINAETQDMTFDQLKKYVDERMTETLHPTAVWHKQTNHTL